MTTFRLLALAGVLIHVVGCAIPEDNFPDIYAKNACKQYEECDEGVFDVLYGEFDDCVDVWSTGAEFILDAGDLLGGEYSPSKARECVNDVRGASCGELATGRFDCDVFE